MTHTRGKMLTNLSKHDIWMAPWQYFRRLVTGTWTCTGTMSKTRPGEGHAWSTFFLPDLFLSWKPKGNMKTSKAIIALPERCICRYLRLNDLFSEKASATLVLHHFHKNLDHFVTIWIVARPHNNFEELLGMLSVWPWLLAGAVWNDARNDWECYGTLAASPVT